MDNNNLKLENEITLLKQYKNVVDASSILTKTDKYGIITYANANFCKLSGYSMDELIGKSHNIVRHPSNSKILFENLWKTIKSKNIWKGIVKNLNKDGSEYFVDATIVPIVDIDGDIVEYISIRNDLTKLLEKEYLLKKSNTDELTGLKNRNALIQDLNLSTNNTIILMDISSFKNINDLYGYRIGDKLLQVISNDLKEFFIDDECELYRIPIDLFILNFSNKYKLNKITQKIDLFLKKLRKYPKLLGNIQVYTSAILGISNDKIDVFHKADIAMQYAKQNNLSYSIYSESITLKQDLERNIYYTKILNEAIQKNLIINHYQPIVNNKTLKYEKYEALVRIVDDKNNILTPYYFLDTAKSTYLYHHITKNVIEMMIEKFKDLKNDISINITIEDIENEETSKFIIEKLTTCGFANRIVIEIVETEEIKNYENIKKFISILKKIGVKIAIDDFGSGYSNFKYLIDIEADFIKIDGSLIKNIANCDASRAIVESIVSFAQKTNIKTIAEFVETKKIFDVVCELGVDYSQGYYFAPPSADIM